MGPGRGCHSGRGLRIAACGQAPAPAAAADRWPARAMVRRRAALRALQLDKDPRPGAQPAVTAAPRSAQATVREVAGQDLAAAVVAVGPADIGRPAEWLGLAFLPFTSST